MSEDAPDGALPSWHDGPTKQAIVEFVAAVTDEAGPDYVPPADRIAVFDNDGTLWAEQPVYPQAFFALDEIARIAPDHPEWAGAEPWESILSGDPARMATLTEADIAEALSVAFSGMPVEQYAANVAAWFAEAKHPVLQRRYHEITYQPQLELLAFLADNGFTTWIVSGGGVDFMRVFSQDVYGIPPERVIGSAGEVTWETINGQQVLVKQPTLGTYNDKHGKPINIHMAIGKRPIVACGNSDGDHEMLQHAAAGEGPSLLLLVHHDDAEREFAYARGSKIGGLDAALDESTERGWTVVSMKDDWATIFPASALPSWTPPALQPTAAPASEA